MATGRLGRSLWRIIPALAVMATAVTVTAVLPASGAGAIINVPADQPTIQAAVNAAASGDTIRIAPGTYQGGVWVQDKALTFTSWYQGTGNPLYIDQTVITGYVAGYCGGTSGCAGNAVLEFGSRAGGSSVVGLTVSGGADGVRSNARTDVSHSKLTANEDGADYGNGAGGTFFANTFSQNTDDGIDLNGTVEVDVLNNTISDNGDDGIEFRMYPYTGPVLAVNVRANRFTHNDSDGIQLIDSPDASSRVVRIERNLFNATRKASIGAMPDQNTNEDYSGAALGEKVYVLNNTFAGENYGVVGGANSVVANNLFSGITAAAVRRVGGNSTVTHNLFWNATINAEDSNLVTATTVTADPLLTAGFTLSTGSPAIDAGTASLSWMGETVTAPGSFLGAAPDLGAYEFDPNAPVPNVAPVVGAGADVSVVLPSGVALDGTVSDDGLPVPASLSTAWSQVSGPGTTFANPAAVDTTATFSVPGVYTLQLTASDGSLSASDTLVVTVAAAPPPGSGSAEARITVGSDDAEESATGAFSASSSDLELVFDGSNQQVGLRFPGLTVPVGATITNAWVQFEADETQSEATTLSIAGQATDNPATFSSTNKISTRPRTTAAVTWTPVPWTVVSEVGPNQRTPNLAPVVQEIVSRAGWASGNAVALVITGTGHRTARAVEVKPAGAPLLHVDYTTGASASNLAPVVNAGPDQVITLPAPATLDGTASDDGLPTPPALTTTWSQVTGPGTTTFTDASAPHTTATFSTPGTYTLQLSATDGALTTTDTTQVTVLATAGTTSAEVRITLGSDDAEESAAGSFSGSSSDLELVFDGSNQLVGLRFPALGVPRGAIITSAWVQFEADETQSEATSVVIAGQAADSPATFSSTSKISTRPRTAASVAWSPLPWTTVGEVGPNQRTPNLAPVVQEIVNRPGWSSGNALALVITGSGHRTARAVEGRAAGAALLHVEYTIA